MHSSDHIRSTQTANKHHGHRTEELPRERPCPASWAARPSPSSHHTPRRKRTPRGPPPWPSSAAPLPTRKSQAPPERRGGTGGKLQSSHGPARKQRRKHVRGGARGGVTFWRARVFAAWRRISVSTSSSPSSAKAVSGRASGGGARDEDGAGFFVRSCSPYLCIVAAAASGLFNQLLRDKPYRLDVDYSASRLGRRAPSHGYFSSESLAHAARFGGTRIPWSEVEKKMTVVRSAGLYSGAAVGVAVIWVTTLS
jgi:hypothetical protein